MSKDRGDLIRYAIHADGTVEHGRRGQSRAHEPISGITLNDPEKMTTLREDRFPKRNSVTPSPSSVRSGSETES